MPYDQNQRTRDRSRRARRGVLAAAFLLPALLAAGCGAPGGADASGGTPPGGGKPGDTAPASPPGSAPKSPPSPSASGEDRPLTGRTVVVDPGHNPGNFRHTSEIGRQVDVGTHRKECDTTGTATQAGYREADFTLDVARRLRSLLESRGARVLLTHDGDRPFGPCIDERARFGNEARADAVVSVHADGSAAGNRGFHVILPARVEGGGADTSAIVGPSRELGEHLVEAFARATATEPADYLGGGTGIDVRSDLGGLNLSTVPKVFVECGNMRNGEDAALLSEGSWRQRAAEGMADGIGAYLAR
ncbi:N-acetylmuramoyl-L-alanine amidase [Streptomyces sp. C10-9-1]|uniref:N-acetylmuramoyl-L-alanine amidase n=1 Tax=Streptomyces sp. C10-9-1 TaxID=1859285 RepID=UPI002112C974|nr:N-acetylmuramoyl-L-alanine amidase [Streptomyces sp. C10-9-1]MCQ6553585.1 N-acetylmuramoyl-L-alanine amidase [Streptomyces sp. C10-9-1]